MTKVLVSNIAKKKICEKVSLTPVSILHSKSIDNICAITQKVPGLSTGQAISLGDAFPPCR